MENDGFRLWAAEDTPGLRTLADQWTKAVESVDFAGLEKAGDALARKGELFADITPIRWRRIQKRAMQLSYDGGCLLSVPCLRQCAVDLAINFKHDWPEETSVFICLPYPS